MGKEKDTLIVVSDLHLSAGFNEETKRYSREEDFSLIMSLKDS